MFETVSLSRCSPIQGCAVLSWRAYQPANIDWEHRLVKEYSARATRKVGLSLERGQKNTSVLGEGQDKGQEDDVPDQAFVLTALLVH